ncbi:MAG: hypothetical protein JJ964_15290, partial [Rhizobiales bacterium]|nr:hypothetical protein [Hyphomicrobiales bacterium]
MKKYLDNLKISTSIALFSTILLIVSLSVIGTIIYSILSSHIAETATNQQ